jgi:hypothetical protein
VLSGLICISYKQLTRLKSSMYSSYLMLEMFGLSARPSIIITQQFLTIWMYIHNLASWQETRYISVVESYIIGINVDAVLTIGFGVYPVRLYFLE